MLLKHLPLFFFLKVPLPCFVRSAFLFQLCMLLYHSNPPCLPLLACLSLLALSLSLSSLFPSVVYVAVSQQPSLLASPCSPSGLSLSSIIPSVVYVAVLQQPFLLAPSCSPLLLALRLVPRFPHSSSCVCCCITATLLTSVLWRPLSPVASPLRKKIL